MHDSLLHFVPRYLHRRRQAELLVNSASLHKARLGKWVWTHFDFKASGRPLVEQLCILMEIHNVQVAPASL